MSRIFWLMAAMGLLCAGPLPAQETKQPATTASAAAAAVSGPEAQPARTSPWLGVEVSRVSPALRSQLGLPEKQGLVVEALTAGGPAEKAGVKLYDVLMKADGKNVADVADLLHAMKEAKEDKLALEVVRGGKPQTISVALGHRALAAEGWGNTAFATPSEADAEALAKLMERLRREVGGGPMEFRFSRPGLILPPGGPLALKLPENTSVVVTREGDKPAKIMVKQGDKKWEITEDEINKLPEALRPVVEQMLGLGPFSFPETSGALPEPSPGGPLPLRSEARHGDMLVPALPGESRLEKRLDDLSRQVEQLRKAVEQSRPAHPGKDKPAPPTGDVEPPPPPGGALK